jgi:primosomal protein N' (replication factor Y)
VGAVSTSPTPAAEADAAAFAEVAVALPVGGTYTYGLPTPLRAAVRVGARVRVPFGRRETIGYVVALRPDRPVGPREVRDVGEVVGEAPLDAEQVGFLLWAADYYLAPPGEMLRAACPGGIVAGETRRVRLVDAGRAGGSVRAARVVAALQAAPEHELDERVLRQKVGDANSVLGQLAERGVIERICVARPARVRVVREETFALAREPTEAERAHLARAPRRLAVLERIRSAGGAPVAVSALRELSRAAAAARALARAGLLQRGERERLRDPFAGEPTPSHPAPTLRPRQLEAVTALEAALVRGGYAGFLLHGVTGSGKTEVYLRLIAAARRAGRGAIVLVPEISLTPQLAARFRARFGDDLAVLHSGLSDGERFDAWRRLMAGQVGIALGARSAVFAPVRDLGVVVVDEEHDASFKQEEGVRYHGRDLALVRAQRAGAVCVLGSATPALETFHNATRGGRLGLLELPERATSRALPAVEVIDLRRYRPEREGLLSAPLAVAIEETLRAGEQTILFLNRRGFATFLLCKSCGQVLGCPHCSVTLTLHRQRAASVCHYCGFSEPRRPGCAHCGKSPLAELGVGTERVEAALKERFPEARIGRLDRDTSSGGGLRRVLDAMGRGELDILVGTQMVTKGHDFPGVTLVGVVLADTGLHLPDFRAGERTFQLLEQVAGRAGRGERAGRVLVQTYCPTHPAIACAAQHDYGGFVQSELAARQELGYPPFGRLVALRVDGPDGRAVERVAARLGQRARALVADWRGSGPETPDLSVLGPAEAPIARIRGRVRWQLVLRGTDRRRLRQLVRLLLEADRPPPGVRVAVDVDPMTAL